MSAQQLNQSFLDKIKSQMSSTDFSANAGSGNWTPRAPERTRHVIQTNRFDDRAWGRARATRNIGDLIGDLHVGDKHKGGTREVFDPAGELAEGVFQAAYKAVPKLRRKREVVKDCYPVRQIVEEILESPKLQDLHQYTAGDVTLATVATEAMGDELREILSRVADAPGKNDQFSNPPPQGGQQPPPQPGQPGDQPGDQSGGQQPGQPDPNGQPQEGQPGQPGQGSEGQEQDLTEGADQEFDPDAEEGEEEDESDWRAQWDQALGGVDMDRLAGRALEAAQKEVEEIDSARRGIGLEDAEWQLMSPEERLAIAERLRTDEMKTLAAVVGRMRRFALGVKAQRIVDVPHDPYDVEKGADIERVLKSEFALLGTRATSYEFYHRFATKSLLQLKMRGKKDVGKGPIVLCVDKSGSMDGAPMNWALGVSEALRRFAADEGRDMYVMFFGTNRQRERFEFPKGKAPFDKILAFLGVKADGGTEFDGVLTEGLKRASEQFDGEGKGKADIVFITDGRANLSSDWIAKFNAERQRIGVRVYSVYIGGAYDTRGKEGPLGLLQQISDATIPVKELRPSAVETVFQRV